MFSIGIYECDFICVNERYFFFLCLSIYIYIYLYLYYDYRNKFNGNYVVLLVGFYYQYYMLQSFLIQSTHNIRDRKKNYNKDNGIYIFSLKFIHPLRNLSITRY